MDVHQITLYRYSDLPTSSLVSKAGVSICSGSIRLFYPNVDITKVIKVTFTFSLYPPFYQRKEFRIIVFYLSSWRNVYPKKGEQESGMCYSTFSRWLRDKFPGQMFSSGVQLYVTARYTLIPRVKGE